MRIEKVKEGLDAETVSGKEKFLSGTVPQGKRKHAIKSTEAGSAPLLISVDNNFGIGLGVESITRLLQFQPELLEIVNLSVIYNTYFAGLVAHGLVSGRRQINYAES